MTAAVPDRPFIAAELRNLGLTRHRVRCLVEQGELRHPFQGIFVPATYEDSLEGRAQLVGTLIAPDHVICDRTAAWVHSIDTLTSFELDLTPPVEVAALPGREPLSRGGVMSHTRDLAPRDIETVTGVKVTTRLRTALDLGCLLHRRDAMAALDAFARIHGITRDLLAGEAVRFAGRRGVVQLRELIPLVDPLYESHRESWTKLEIYDAGLPLPEPQHWILVDGVPTYRLDLAWPRLRVAVEYNGFDAHERTLEQIHHDRERLAWLQKNGWTVIVVRNGDFTGLRRDRWIQALGDALRPSYSNLRRLERKPSPR